MAFLKRFFPFLMRASIRGPTSLAPDGRSCHAACGGKQRAKPLKQRTRSQVKHSLACAVQCRRIICFLISRRPLPAAIVGGLKTRDRR